MRLESWKRSVRKFNIPDSSGVGRFLEKNELNILGKRLSHTWYYDIDDQIVILDEARREKFLSLKQRLKLAFAIILGAYLTAAVSMLPLLWAGAGLLKGFAFTTLIGITAGVFITRPAFSDMVRKMEE